jgi:hypothetical protein
MRVRCTREHRSNFARESDPRRIRRQVGDLLIDESLDVKLSQHSAAKFSASTIVSGFLRDGHPGHFRIVRLHDDPDDATVFIGCLDDQCSGGRPALMKKGANKVAAGRTIL